MELFAFKERLGKAQINTIVSLPCYLIKKDLMLYMQLRLVQRTTATTIWNENITDDTWKKMEERRKAKTAMQWAKTRAAKVSARQRYTRRYSNIDKEAY